MEIAAIIAVLAPTTWWIWQLDRQAHPTLDDRDRHYARTHPIPTRPAKKRRGRR